MFGRFETCARAWAGAASEYKRPTREGMATLDLDGPQRPAWSERHGGIEWSNDMSIAARGARGGGTVCVVGPEVPTDGKVLIVIRIIESNGQDRENGIPVNRGWSIGAGIALDWQPGLPLNNTVSMHLATGVMTHCDANGLSADGRHGHQGLGVQALAPCTFDIAGRELELVIDRGELRMAWRPAGMPADVATEEGSVRIDTPTLGNRVRPWVKMFTPNDKVELVTIQLSPPGAALAFALAMNRVSQPGGLTEEGVDIPVEIAGRIWMLVVRPWRVLGT